MKCILLILDGLGDRGHAAFGGQTPLQMASTRNLDRLAALGMTGMYHPLVPGVALPSEIAHFLLFGYDLPRFPGSGYIEALGENIPVADADVTLLGRILSVKNSWHSGMNRYWNHARSPHVSLEFLETQKITCCRRRIDRPRHPGLRQYQRSDPGREGPENRRF